MLLSILTRAFFINIRDDRIKSGIIKLISLERGKKMEIKEVIVVEGKNDTFKIKQAVEADTIETNGSALDEATINLIRHAQQKRGVIIFTDPDYPGEKIRQTIDRNVSGCKHAFLMKHEAQSNESIGIEHATVEAIQHALQNVYEAAENDESDIEKHHLIAYGLIGGKGAREKREQLGALLHIGYTNGKQLLQRLHMFRITKKELDRAMMHIIEGGGTNA